MHPSVSPGGLPPPHLRLRRKRGGEELREHVVEAISGLPERLKLVVQLYFVEELNLGEIAEALSVSVPRVHQLKAQALGKLREALEGVAEII